MGDQPNSEPSAIVPAVTGGKRAALEALLSGKSVAETARSIGVARRTLYLWLRNDARFRAAYNQWHDEMEQSARSRLLTLADQATDAVAKALEAGDAKTAMQLLKGMGILSPAPPRLTDAEEIRQQTELDAARRRTERECKARSLETDKAVTEAELNAFADKSRK
jgi:Helix-turn-helix domain